MTEPNYRSQLAHALEASFIDENTDSDELMQAKLLTNDYEKRNKVLATLLRELYICDSFMFSVAFITKGGITMLLNAFESLKANGIKGKILTSTYQMFNTPEVFKQLLKLSDIVDVRIYDYKNFHAKGYVFQRKDVSNFIVGSSNLTQNALTYNHEWNIKMNSTFEGALIKEIEREFNGSWERSSDLTEQWIENYELEYNSSKIIDINIALEAQANQGLKLNRMQREALDSLEELRLQGKDKALLISATGTGKTYLSAFDVMQVKPKKFLFIIHRENVARRAMESFQHVLGDEISMAVLSGNHKLNDTPADYIFATIQTLHKERYLEKFPAEYFDYIVIDEVHRAGAETYTKILNHFKPKFLLGMSATPERTDGFNIVELFDYNIAYEIRLQQAMEYDLLCPFHYFGVNEFSVDGVFLDEQSDFNRLIDERRIEHIISKIDYFGHSSNRVRGLVFCSRKDEAIQLSKSFSQRGFNTTALTGDSSEESRRIAIDRLEQYERTGGFDYIFTVDIFNEGIDIPRINQIVMLRPTESSIIFIQQLGRGLRKADKKEYVVVLDFIGNYKNNFMIPIALSGDRTYNKDNIRRFAMEGNNLIPGCSTINFDEVTKSKIYDSINKVKFQQLHIIKKEYQILKNIVGRIPTLTDFYEHGAIDPDLIFKKFKTYYEYLVAHESSFVDRLTDKQKMVIQFVTTEFANGHRPHEALIIKQLIDNKFSLELLSHDLEKRYSLINQGSQIEHSIGILSDKYLQNKDRKKYGGCRFILEKESGYQLDEYFLETLQSQSYKEMLLDLVNYCLLKYENEFYNLYEDTGLVLYEKYTRREMCRILKWENDEGSTINGYRVKHEMCPIFVTYNKGNEISYTTRYKDEFLNRHQFSWMTRSPRRLTSEEIRPILEQETTGLDIHLFIKKSDDEGSAHYYLGRLKKLDVRETFIADKANTTNTKPIVNFRFALKDSVREDVYEYLIS